jgi:ABC-type polysaccharide/polyol phosphate export permease
VYVSLRRLYRYRALIWSLTARDIKARYRGSVLGFLWSFINPLLLLLIYSFVFTVVLADARPPDLKPFALFMFCGILPWSWFSASLLESSTVLVSGGNLIKKVLFPAEVLPITTVLAHLVHFCLGLPVLLGFLLYYGLIPTWSDLLWLPVVIAAQLLLTIGLALLVSVLTVHFRDVRDLLAQLLTFWFFATPIIYPLSQAPQWAQRLLALNPMTTLVGAYQEILFGSGRVVGSSDFLAVVVLSFGVCVFGYVVFDRLRDTLAEQV